MRILRQLLAAGLLASLAFAFAAPAIAQPQNANPSPNPRAAAIVAALNAGGNVVLTGNFSANAFTANASQYFGASSQWVMRGIGTGAWRLSDFGETIKVGQAVEANHAFAQRDGVNAQTFRIYNTYTDASNYERAGLYWSANKFMIESGQAAGTGTGRDLGLLGGGTSLDVTANVINMFRNGTSNTTLFNASGTSLTSTAQNFFRLTPTINQASGTYNVLDINPTETAIGAGPHYLIRGRIGAGSVLWGVRNTGHIELGKLTDPSAPSANFGFLYMRDNGGGKMQVAARFPSGAVQVIATEP